MERNTKETRRRVFAYTMDSSIVGLRLCIMSENIIGGPLMEGLPSSKDIIREEAEEIEELRGRLRASGWILTS